MLNPKPNTKHDQRTYDYRSDIQGMADSSRSPFDPAKNTSNALDKKPPIDPKKCYQEIMSNVTYLYSTEQPILSHHKQTIDKLQQEESSSGLFGSLARSFSNPLREKPSPTISEEIATPRSPDTETDWFGSFSRTVTDYYSGGKSTAYTRSREIAPIEETWQKIQIRKREVYDTLATVDQYIKTSHTLAQETFDGSQELQAQYQEAYEKALVSKKAFRERIQKAVDYETVSKAVKDYSLLTVNQTDNSLIREVSKNATYLTKDQQMKLPGYQRAIAHPESAGSSPKASASSPASLGGLRRRRLAGEQRPAGEGKDVGRSTARESSREADQRRKIYLETIPSQDTALEPKEIASSNATQQREIDPDTTPSQDTALGPKETAIIELKKLWLDIQDRQQEKARLFKTGEQRFQASHDWVEKTFQDH